MHKAVMPLAGALLATAMAGCGSTSATASAASSPSSSTASSTSPSTSSSPSASGSAGIKTGTVKVSGKATTVFENSKGYTLYYFTKDTPTHSACDTNATCSKLWHPFKAASAPAVSGVSGTFSLLKGQVEYQGHLLYTYTGDTAPAQAKGEGLFKEWWVATPSLKAAGGGSSGSSGSSHSSGSGW
ncbi:MAG: hypothetical protein M0Z36_13820 [Thermaerobacter sp.]|nr:hypothetical protein [Thermaerobacter sp.]